MAERAMRQDNKFKSGDKVEWNTTEGKAHRRTVKKQTSDAHIKIHEATASKGDPHYIATSQ